MDRIPAATAVVVAALGCVVLSGWVFGVSVLKSGVPGLVEMKANTAVCFLLVAAAVWLLRRPLGGRGRSMGRFLAAVAALVALVSLCEWVFGRDFGIDQLLFHEAAGAVATSNAGRMAPNTALAFLLVTCALAVRDVRSRVRGWLSVSLALGAALLAFVALVGYVSGVTSLYEVSELTQMAVPTAIAFILLAVAIACARPEAGPVRLVLSDTVGGKVMRRLFPTMLAVPVILGTLRLAEQSAGVVSADTATWLFALSIIALLAPLTWALAASLDRAELASRRAQAARQDALLERAAFEEAPIGSALISPDGRYTRVNRALCTMIGYSAEQLIGMHFAEITHPDDRAQGIASLQALIDGRLTVYHVEKRYLHRDGHSVHVRVAVTTIRDETGHVSQVHVQSQDITEAKLAAHRIEDAQFETLARLAAAAEYRDDDTGAHTRRVGELAGRLAEALGLPAERVRLIRLAAPLHDVGKIGIPDAILLKPGRLTEEEFDHMKRHTTIGAQMLAGGVSAQIALAEQIARTHHERWDGTGYPAGLAGDAIPIAGRIVAVADVFDALTHVRPYKTAWPRAEALAELRRQRGRQFDREVIDALLALEREPEHTTDLTAQPRQSSPHGQSPRMDPADEVLRQTAATGRSTNWDNPSADNTAASSRWSPGAPRACAR
ncbi:MAG TPA: HD domain-containing phosphohydrolase [Baekduia sp.]|nr:HD domain-containing phosphohydrolase [Baekduia sp.]